MSVSGEGLRQCSAYKIIMTQGGLLDADYSDRDLQAAHEASKKQSEKLHQRAIKFFKKICPFGK